MKSGECFLRTTPDGGGRPVVTQHTVWDLNRFLAARQAEQRKLREDDKPAATVELATEAEYRKAHWQKRRGKA